MMSTEAASLLSRVDSRYLHSGYLSLRLFPKMLISGLFVFEKGDRFFHPGEDRAFLTDSCTIRKAVSPSPTEQPTFIIKDSASSYCMQTLCIYYTVILQRDVVVVPYVVMKYLFLEIIKCGILRPSKISRYTAYLIGEG